MGPPGEPFCMVVSLCAVDMAPGGAIQFSFPSREQLLYIHVSYNSSNYLQLLGYGAKCLNGSLKCSSSFMCVYTQNEGMSKSCHRIVIELSPIDNFRVVRVVPVTASFLTTALVTKKEVQVIEILAPVDPCKNWVHCPRYANEVTSGDPE